MLISLQVVIFSEKLDVTFLHLKVPELLQLQICLETPKQQMKSVLICSKLIIKTQERCHRSGVFIANFEQISHIRLVFPLLNLNK